MKTVSPALLTLMTSGQDYVRANCWSITLIGGSVLRWTSADRDITFGGQTWSASGPVIVPGTISEKRGLEVGTTSVKIVCDNSDLVNGVPIGRFIVGHGLDGANLRLDRAYTSDWGQPIVGMLNRFAGRITSIVPVSGESFTLVVSDWRILLNAKSPPNLYQSQCNHSLYDAGCGILKSAHEYNYTVSSATLTTVVPSATAGADFFDQGQIVFTSGACAGVSRTIKSNGVSLFTLIKPLPAVPAPGDTFHVYPGCPLTQAVCLSKFNNLGRFKGTPYAPVPETAL